MRETIKETFGRFEVEYKSYATTREVNALRDVGGSDESKNTSKQEEVIINQLVVSVVDVNTQLVTSTKVYDFIIDNLEFADEYVPLVTRLAEVIQSKKK